MLNTSEELQYLSRVDLIKKWKKLFNKNSPQHARKKILIKQIVNELELRKKSVQTQIDDPTEKSGEEEGIETLKKNSTIEIKPGTKLIREYKGEKHEVTVFEKGFDYNNKVYKSLSGIAKEITGTSWNGKVFFGVKK